MKGLNGDVLESIALEFGQFLTIRLAVEFKFMLALLEYILAD